MLIVLIVFEIGVVYRLSVIGNDMWKVQKITWLMCIREI